MNTRRVFTALGVAALCAASANATPIITGTLTATAGNNGNPVVRQSVSTSGLGSLSIGPLSGPVFGGNLTSGMLTIAATPVPALSLHASGSDLGIYPANSASTFGTMEFTVHFDVVGPVTGVPVPVTFSGSTFGTETFTGYAPADFNRVGTSVRIIAPNVASTFHAIGPQSGQAPDFFSPNPIQEDFGWGDQSPAAVAYSSYASGFRFGATLSSTNSLTGLETIRIRADGVGGTSGQLIAPNEVSTGTVDVFIDPFIEIDPAWLVDHPGFSIVVDDGVGNIDPSLPPPIPGTVPEPATTALVALPLLGLLIGARRRRSVLP